MKKLAALLLVLTLVVVGCGRAPTPTPVPPTPIPAGPTTVPQEATAAPTEEPTKAPPQEIVVALDTEIDTMELDAFKSDAAYVLDANTQERAVDYVWEPGPQDTWKSGSEFEGVLAEPELSADGKVLTLRVRKGVTFYNGNPVDAQAFKHSYDRHISLAGGVTKPMMDMALGAVPEGSTVDQVELVDDSTIRLHLTKPNRKILSYLATTVVPIIDPAVTKEHATADDPWAKVWEQAECRDLVHKRRIGQARCSLFRAKAVVSIYEELLRTDPFALFGVESDEWRARPKL